MRFRRAAKVVWEIGFLVLALDQDRLVRGIVDVLTAVAVASEDGAGNVDGEVDALNYAEAVEEVGGLDGGVW
jgi:hypothetical protein